MRHILLISIVMFTGSVLLSAQGQEYDAESFHGIKISGAFEVYLTQSEEYSVTAELSKDLIDKVNIEVQDGLLIIGYRNMISNHNQKTKWKWDRGNKTIIVNKGGTKVNRVEEKGIIHISFPALDQISLSGIVEATSTNKLELENLEIIQSGASGSQLNVDANRISMQISGAALCKLETQVSELALRTNGAGCVELKGAANLFRAQTSGGSEVNAKNLQSVMTIVKSSGGSEIWVWTKSLLEVNASGGSDVFYKSNDCEKILIESSGGAAVKKF